MLLDRKDFYTRLESELNTKLLIYITGDRLGLETVIHPEVLDYFAEHLDTFDKTDKITLLLYTRGGSTLAAFGLVNLIRQFCKKFEVIIPAKALSAGTLISLGANNIIMTNQATLGAIDPSLNLPLNPANPTTPQNPGNRVPVSVESIKGYIQLAGEDFKIKNEHDLKDVLINLSNHVHPLVLGDVFRSRLQIQMLAKKLLSHHVTDQSKIQKIISFLSSDSGSHDYTVYSDEAKEELGLPIEKPSEVLYKTIRSIFQDIKKELELGQPLNYNNILGTNTSAPYRFRRGLIESAHLGTHVFISEGQLSKTTQIMPQMPPLPPIQRAVIDDQRTFEGWRFETKTF